MGGYRGRNSRGGPRRPGRSSWSSQGRTRRGGRSSSKGNNLGRWGIGLGIAAGGALAVAGALHGYAGVSHSIKTLAGDFKAVKKWTAARKASKEVLAASTLKFKASRTLSLKKASKIRVKYRSPNKPKFKVRRHGKR